MNAPCRLALAFALLLSTSGEAVAAADGRDEGRAALDKARAAYRAAGAFRETLEATLEFPDGRKEPRVLEYGVGPTGGAFFTLSSNGKTVFQIVARDGRMVGTQLGADGRYAEVPFEGDFAAALRRMGGAQAQLGPPPAVVARLGGDLAAFLDALRFGVLAPLEVVGARRTVAGDGAALVEVELRASNGQLIVGLDPATDRLREARVALGDGKQQVRFSGPYRFTPGDPDDALAWPDLSGRTAMQTFAELESATYPLGQPAPDVSLRSMEGGTVSLASLRGNVVVLDFWATWCVPCWTALTHTSELAAWAKSSGLPVQVFAVDTLEEVSSFEEQSRRVAEFLRSRKLDLPVLLDSEGKAFAALHKPGLPSLVILSKDGKLVHYHSGLLEDMTATVRKEVLALTAAQWKGGCHTASSPLSPWVGVRWERGASPVSWPLPSREIASSSSP
ncbi:MAG TPA: TlpA disulfide reductase family protein [Thermoanaerobaculia bacterium]|nr:TlpA disulfide reductase family protein [Thermoanaerobaculia bacterium]